MKTLPKPFERPITIGDLDCLVTLRVTGYTRGDPGSFNPLDGGWPTSPPEVEFEIVSVRLDEAGSVDLHVSGLAELLAESEELRDACLDAIEEANQPPDHGDRGERDDRIDEHFIERNS